MLSILIGVDLNPQGVSCRFSLTIKLSGESQVQTVFNWLALSASILVMGVYLEDPASLA